MKRIATLVCFLILSLCTAVLPTVSAAAVGYAPTEGASFNNPRGTRAQQLVLTNQIAAAIDNVPKGSVIRVTAYSMSEATLRDKLIAAHKRGVDVRMILDDHVTTADMAKLQTVLGKDRTKGSFLIQCKQSCMSDTGMMHAKYFTFSRTGSVTHVTMVSSGNPTYTGESILWNDMYTVVGNVPIYNSFIDYFTAMLADKNNPDYYRTVTDGKYKSFFYPQAQTDDPNDTIIQSLAGVKCDGVGTGYGYQGHTVIKIAMFRWSAARASIARRLWDLDNQGCVVQVITNKSSDVAQEVFAALLKPGGKHGGIDVFNGQFDLNGDGHRDVYIHHKYMAIDGNYAGDTTAKVTFMGSINFEWGPERDSNEDMLKITDNATNNAFMANFNLMRDKYTAPIKTVPTTTELNALAGPADLSDEEEDQAVN